MSAREESPTWTIDYDDGKPACVGLLESDYQAMCERIDALTQQEGELRRTYDLIAGPFSDALAELRSLRAAVARAEAEYHDGAYEYNGILERLFELVPSDNSWETEQ